MPTTPPKPEQAPYWTNGHSTLHHADARSLPLPDRSVHCIVTSPPYFRMRDYDHPDAIGLEDTLQEYIQALLQVSKELRRVLRPDGTMWMVLGDCYAGGGRGQNTDGTQAHGRNQHNNRGSTSMPIIRGKRKHRGPDSGRWGGGDSTVEGLQPKQLVGVPWRVAFALQAQGWILRRDIIWHKTTPMTESARDRPTTAHEYIFLLTSQPRYFYDRHALYQTVSPVTIERRRRIQQRNPQTPNLFGDPPLQTLEEQIDDTANARSVWHIPSQPYPGNHHATYPQALVMPCVLAGTSAAGACGNCGAPWRRAAQPPHIQGEPSCHTNTGWRPGCRCQADPVPATVLDPFVGSGTTCAAAQRLGRNSIGVDLNTDYLDQAGQRIQRLPHPMSLPM